jgi:tRNA (cytidine56-2'-O)-methyltransferase
MKVTVLRLGHRVGRDARITTHVGLIARALGADEVVMSGQRDERILETLRKVTETWGGPFEARYEENWLGFLKKAKEDGRAIVHLTAYGLPVDDVLASIRASGRDLVVVVGAEKVPGIVYRLADWNVAISSQPHSECGSLAVFLDRLFEGRELSKEFEGARLKIVPMKVGKKVIRCKGPEARKDLSKPKTYSKEKGRNDSNGFDGDG